jgi:hypothetical protein
MELLLVHAAATLVMTGVIWIVQVVLYPLFALVGRPGFPAYEAAHSRRITWVVAPAMITEAGCAALIVLAPPAGIPAWAAWAGFAGVVALWLSTALLQVPQHRRLEPGFDDDAHRRLVAIWSGRGVLALWMVAQGA